MTEDDTFNKLRKWPWHQISNYIQEGHNTDGNVLKLAGWTREEWYEFCIEHRLGE